MTVFWILTGLTLLSFAGEYFLSYRRGKWPGLILPLLYFCAAAVFMALNLLDVFPNMESYGVFLTVHGSAGFFAVVLKLGFVFLPVMIQLVIYVITRHCFAKKHHPAAHNREYKKMLADDL